MVKSEDIFQEFSKYTNYEQDQKSNSNTFINRKKSEVPSEDDTRLLLFFSYDLVNSSRFKRNNYNNWHIILSKIFSKIKKIVKKEIEDSFFWRSIGDEIVFIIEIYNQDQLSVKVKEIYETLIILTEKIEKLDFIDDVDKLVKHNNILSIKATAWVAVVTLINENSPLNKGIYNMAQEFNSESSERPYIEFQGNDIDTGFRIEKYARKKTLTLSFELAYLISKETDVASNIHIITFKVLKGIWSERPYPIIWYFDSHIADMSLIESFDYDEHEHSEIISEYYNRDSESRIPDLREREKKDTRTRLTRLKDNLNLDGKISEMENKSNFNNIKRNVAWLDYNGDMQKITYEIHCVAICLSKDKSKILLFKRKCDLNEKFSEKWDFGCVNIRSGYKIEEYIELEYKNQYNLDITVLDPYKTYSFEDKRTKQIIPGIRFIAEVKNEELPDEINDKKYVECRYFNLEEFMLIKEDIIDDDGDNFELIFTDILESE